jgi:chemotaxis protein CheY-P-specific phosphatase CheC
MTRPEKKRKVREWHKQISKMSLGQFETFLESLIQQHVTETEEIIEKALRKDFKFGDKRIMRLRGTAQAIYDSKPEVIINE